MPSHPQHKSSSPWSDPTYWHSRFTSHDTPWELWGPSSVVCEAIDELHALGTSARGRTALCPGCGRGSDALELLRRGTHVTAIDWSDVALEELTKQARAENQQGSLTVISGDFFQIPVSPLDLVVEHTFFCAIDPGLRGEYASRVSSWLRPGGFLIGDLFIISDEEIATLPNLSIHGEAGGPPFVTTQSALEALLAPYFITRRLHPATKPNPSRKSGMEWVGIFERR